LVIVKVVIYIYKCPIFVLSSSHLLWI
jgi:hypothetical protein